MSLRCQIVTVTLSLTLLSTHKHCDVMLISSAVWEMGPEVWGHWSDWHFWCLLFFPFFKTNLIRTSRRSMPSSQLSFWSYVFFLFFFKLSFKSWLKVVKRPPSVNELFYSTKNDSEVSLFELTNGRYFCPILINGSCNRSAKNWSYNVLFELFIHH